MSLKDNFNQAMKEILKKDGFVGKNLSEESKKSSSLDGYLGQNGGMAPQDTEPAPSVSAAAPVSAAPSENTAAERSAPYAAPQTEQPSADNTVYAAQGAEAPSSAAAAEYSAGPAYKTPDSRNYSDDFSAPPREEADPFSYAARPQSPAPKITPPPQPRTVAPPERQYTDNEETTVISKNIVISGGTVTGFANVRIDGSIQGDIRITKDVSVTGKVVGDIECNNAVMAGSAVQGSVSSKGQLRMDRDSVLLGDVNTQYLDMNGRIKGTVDVTGKAEFKSDSVVIGDITASTITVLDGAVIKGFVNTTFLQDNSANVFPDTISVSDE
ncbi:MAG: polymer-forming cytoskeletal protein [Oscillospiraceae bacterium]